MERGRKEEMGRKKKGSIGLLLLAVLQITMPAIASGNYSSKNAKSNDSLKYEIDANANPLMC